MIINLMKCYGVLGHEKKPVYAEFPAMEAYYEVEVIIPDDLFEVGKMNSEQL